MSHPSLVQGTHRRRRRGFAERLVQGFMGVMEQALCAEGSIARRGYLQGLDPRIKLVGLLALIVSAVLTKSLTILAALFVLAVALAYFSCITPAQLYKQVWIGVLIFTGMVALPACVLVPGNRLLQLPLVHWEVSVQGLRSFAFLIGRAETTATLALLLILSTPWTHVLKAMRVLGVPVVFVAILAMTHRYIFVLLHTATQMFEARRSRIVAPMSGAQQRAMVAAATGVLLGKAFQLSSEAHLAMVSRGYRGECRLLDEFRARARDWLALSLALAVPALILWTQP